MPGRSSITLARSVGLAWRFGRWSGTVRGRYRSSESPEAVLDPYRLPRTAVPSRYDIRLEPDLVALTFSGEETITLTVTEPVTEITMNAVELAVTEAVIEDG